MGEWTKIIYKKCNPNILIWIDNNKSFHGSKYNCFLVIVAKPLANQYQWDQKSIKIVTNFVTSSESTVFFTPQVLHLSFEILEPKMFRTKD